MNEHRFPEQTIFCGNTAAGQPTQIHNFKNCTRKAKALGFSAENQVLRVVNVEARTSFPTLRNVTRSRTSTLPRPVAWQLHRGDQLDKN